MTKYHVNPLGDVHPCTAAKQCRFGLKADEHADSPEAARAAYEEKMNSVNPLEGLKKGFNDRDRAKRQEGGTVRHQLEAKFGADALEEALAKKVSQRQFGISFLDDPMGGRVIGLAYGGDFKAEEEYGQAELASFYEEGKGQSDAVKRVESSEGPVYVFLNLGSRYGRHDDRAVEYSAEAAVKRAERGEERVGEFQTGRALAIVPKDELEIEVLDRLVEAAEHNSLRFGSSSNPFSRSGMIYDSRDLSVGMMKEVEVRKKWQKEELAKTEPIREKFRAKGQAIYAISRPSLGFTSLVGRDGPIDPNTTYYWLNSGSVRDLDGKQAFGYYTLEELDRFADGDWSLAKERAKNR